MKTEAMREYMRVHRVLYDAAREIFGRRRMRSWRLWKEQVKLEEQKRDAREHNVKIFAQLLMECDEDFSHQEQVRKRERSKDACSKRGDVDEVQVAGPLEEHEVRQECSGCISRTNARIKQRRSTTTAEG